MKLIDLLSEKSAFLFDFDGVVTDSEIYAFSVLRSIVKDNYGIDIDDEDIEYTIGLDANGTADAISRKYLINLSGDEFISFLSEYPVYYTDYEGITAFPGLEELFRKIKERGFKIAIVSSTIRAHLDAALSRLGLSSYPDIVIGGDMVVNHKPHPEPYLKALEMLDAAASSAIVFEDSPVGILSARNAGIDVIAFCGSVVKQDVSAADAMVSDYAKITGIL